MAKRSATHEIEELTKTLVHYMHKKPDVFKTAHLAATIITSSLKKTARTAVPEIQSEKAEVVSSKKGNWETMTKTQRFYAIKKGFYRGDTYDKVALSLHTTPGTISGFASRNGLIKGQ